MAEQELVEKALQRKGDKPATIGLHPDLEDWKTKQAAQDDPQAYFFPSLANRSGAGRNGLSKAFERIMARRLASLL